MLICDTGVIYGALVRRDRSHEACAGLLADRTDVVVPAPVVVEIDGLATARGAPSVTAALLRSVEDRSVRVVDLAPSDYVRARELLEVYEDLQPGFVDAAIVAIAERLRQATIATLDRRHFSVFRPTHVRAFTLVP